MGRGKTNETTTLLPPAHERRGFYNVVVLGVSFCLLFTSFSAVQNLQTNINKDLGFYSLSVLYSVFAPANFISPYVVLAIGERASLMFGAVCYCIFIAANIKVTTPTLLGASAIVGFGAAVIWTAQGSAVIYNAPAGKLGSYNGLFFGIFQWAQIIGNLLAGILITKGTSDFWLFSILTCVGTTSLIGFLFLRRPQEQENDIPKVKESMSTRLAQTFVIMATREMALLYVAMIYSGVSQTYMFGVFPGSRPKSQVSYIMTAFGAADVIGSLLAGSLSDRIGKVPIVIFCACSMTGGTVILFLEHLKLIPHATYISYLIAILLGIADSGFNTQIYSTLGLVFSNRVEAAVGAYKFFQAGSTAILFFVGPHVSQTFYFVVVLVTLWIGTLFFFVLDATTPKQHKQLTQDPLINT